MFEQKVVKLCKSIRGKKKVIIKCNTCKGENYQECCPAQGIGHSSGHVSASLSQLYEFF